MESDIAALRKAVAIALEDGEPQDLRDAISALDQL